MVWGSVSQHHQTELVVIAGSLNADDNATSHNACSVCDFLQDRNVSVLPWPAKSPDLNPIKHVWDLLDRRVRARAIPSRDVWELAGALVEEWGNISQQELAIWCSP
jgi:transposase